LTLERAILEMKAWRPASNDSMDAEYASLFGYPADPLLLATAGRVRRDILMTSRRAMVEPIRVEVSPDADDAAFVLSLQSGDAAAFEQLVRQHGPRLLRVARRFLWSEEDARDAVQDAFVAAFRSIGRFEASSQLSTWLHRIIINASLMKLRSQRRHPEEDIEQFLPRFLEDGHQVTPTPSWIESADSALERTEVCTLVRSLIERLPEGYRSVLLLRDIEELTTEEVAGLLEITPNAVKVRLHRARQALRALLEPHMRTGVT
jgi:RNA polymerase sigma-70 factor (ECF subfamily)